MAAAFPTAIALQAGFGGGFREQLIAEEHIISVWPLAEVEATSPAYDIAFKQNPGTYTNASGFTRGVPVDLAEGAIGTTFDGVGYVRVPDDGVGYLVAGVDGVFRSLSCASGDFSVTFFIKTTTNDATLRAVVQKCETNSGGNGWYAALQSAGIVFSLKKAGVSVFNFSRGSIADGAWHLIRCVFDAAAGAVRIFIDGVQSGATVSIAGGQDPPLTTADLRIGMFNDGAGGLTATLAFVGLSREDDSGIAAVLQATRPWSTLAAKDLRGVMPIRLRYGIAGASILDNVARPGTLTFALNNGVTNSARLQGYYTPGHANCRSGFAIGIPMRFSLTFGGVTYYKFRGRLASAVPLPGEYREQHVLVTVLGWLDVAMNTYLPALATQSGLRSDQVWGLVLDASDGRSPAAVDVGIGSGQFLYALDIGRSQEESLLSEFARIEASERGFTYEKGDTVQGGTLKREGRGARQIKSTFDATFASTMHGLEVRYGLEHLINVVRVTYTQRRVGPSPIVLYSQDLTTEAVQLAPGQTIVFTGDYRDPAQEAARVGGADMEPLDPGVDFAFWSNSDGSGTDLTANLEVLDELGGSGFQVTFTNPDSLPSGYLRLSATAVFQVRGVPVYHYSQATVVRRDEESIRTYGARAISIDLPYESSQAVAESFADFYLNLFKQQRPVPTSMTIHGWASSALLTQALAREPGDRIGLTEAMTAVSSSVGFFINEVALEVEPGRGEVTATWSLVPGPQTGVWVWDEARFDSTAIFGI